MRFTLILPLFALFSLAAAHSGRSALTLEELAREEIRVREHVAMTRDCEPEIREHVAMRMRRRAEIQKREAEAAGRPFHPRSRHPYYTNIQNMTCLTAPEVIEGPNYVNNELVRQDLRETQQGVKLLMDFGVLDTTTCKPMDSAFVEIWHANATGMYSGYSSLTFETSGSATFNSSQTWLRGGWHTNANGIVELTTIYPTYYDDHAPHIHLMVHKDWVESANGTLVSHSGSIMHIAQIYFPDSWNDQVFATWPYTLNSNNRTLNSGEEFLPGAQANGYSPFVNLHYLNGKDLSGGLVGYITLGVDTRSSYSINNKNYNGQK